MEDIIDFLLKRLKISKNVKVFIPSNLWVKLAYVAGYGGEYFILEEDIEITLLSLGFDSLVRGINARS